MSMDDQFRELKFFQEALIQFNERLENGMRELEKRHESVSPFWQDAFRREYEAVWQPLGEGLHNYLTREGPTYVTFLNDKINALGRFLGV